MEGGEHNRKLFTVAQPIYLLHCLGWKATNPLTLKRGDYLGLAKYQCYHKGSYK